MDTLFLNAHTVRQSLKFRILKTERSDQLALLVGKNTLEERMLTWKQPGGTQKNSVQNARYLRDYSTR